MLEIGVVSAVVSALLIGTSFLSSFITTSMGIGGGTLMLAVMAQVLPANAIVAVHGMVQLGSNFSRVVLFFGDINWKLIGNFALGSLLGVSLAGLVVASLPLAILQIILALFILYSAWVPKPTFASGSRSYLFFGGVITSALTMFVGATGPLVMGLLKSIDLATRSLVATLAMCLTVQHLSKSLVFATVGFDFARYLAPIGLIIVAGFLGTMVGKRVLLKRNKANFTRTLNVILTLLALRLLYDGLTNL